jgi:protease-4
MKRFNAIMSSESQKVYGIVALIVVSIILGGYNQFQETRLQSASGTPKSGVMVIPIEGMISATGTQWEMSLVDTVTDQFRVAASNKAVKAVVLKINSPGGTVGASQELYGAVKRFSTDTKKPVIVSIMDIGASGAYWVALAGDYIFAHPGSIVGSLGVITQTLDLTQVPKKYGIDMRTYKAGPHKDLLNPWRSPTRDDEYLINKLLETVHNQFKQVLITNRNVTPDQAHVLADGRIYAGEDALAEQLVDQLGGLHDAIQYAGKLVGIDDPKVISSERGIKDWVKSFGSMAASFRPYAIPRLQETLEIR